MCAEYKYCVNADKRSSFVVPILSLCSATVPKGECGSLDCQINVITSAGSCNDWKIRICARVQTFTRQKYPGICLQTWKILSCGVLSCGKKNKKKQVQACSSPLLDSLSAVYRLMMWKYCRECPFNLSSACGDITTRLTTENQRWTWQPFIFLTLPQATPLTTVPEQMMSSYLLRHTSRPWIYLPFYMLERWWICSKFTRDGHQSLQLKSSLSSTSSMPRDKK